MHKRNVQLLSVLAVCLLAGTLEARAATDPAALVELGRSLFFDTGLSAKGTQACASCHNPAAAFTDSRDSGVGRAVSLGDDNQSLGDRNAPTILYAALVPAFGRDAAGEYAGGLFHDGRAADLADQAGQPFTNPVEMALPDNAAVVARVRANANHARALRELFGAAVLDDDRAAFRAITESIAAFERTGEFTAFDSKYDRSLRGEYELSPREELGRKLFYSQLFNCHSCHLLETREFVAGEPFSNHRYHNIGVPVNRAVRSKSGLGAAYRDDGLLDNPQVDDVGQAGKFRVPTLRNVAVTGPYMHNGVFRELTTVVLFYNKYTLSNAESQLNPETGRPWGDPEVPETVDFGLLRQGQPISPIQVSALVAFLEALTDRRYEHLLSDNQPTSTE